MQPWENDPVVAPPAPSPNAPWQSDPVVQPPKVPDMTGVQNTVRKNLTPEAPAEGEEAKPTEPQTPAQRFDTGMGMPVSATLRGGSQDTPLPAALRGHLVNSYKNGDAATASDFMQSAIMSTLPIIHGFMNPVDTAKNYLEEVGNSIVGGGARAVGTLAYPFLSEENKQKLIESGQLGDVLPLTGDTAHDTAAKGLMRANALLSPGVGAAYTAIAAPIAPLFNTAISGVTQAAVKAGASPENASLIPAGAEFLMNLGGLGGAAALRGGVHPAATGPWDHVVGNQALKEIVAPAVGKPAEAVTSADIDKTIHEGFKDKAPAAKDFQSVAAVSGADVGTLHNIYRETGVRPDQVFEDARHDPQVAADVSDGKIPEAYEHLIETKPEMPQEEAERLNIVKSETGKSFEVLDKDGDFVQGGFDSAEEAHHFVEDRQTGILPDEPPEWKGKQEPITEKTPAGEQTVIPGAEKISDKELAERKMQEPLHPETTQKTDIGGLFDVESRKQQELFSEATSRPPKPNFIPASEIGKPTSLATFIRNNGGIKDAGGDLKTIGADTLIKGNGKTFDEMGDLAQQAGYFKERPSVNELKDAISNSKSGNEHFREADTDRVLAQKQARLARENLDPAKIEHEAYLAGLDTDRVHGESDKAYVSRLHDALKKFYENEQGAGGTPRKIIGDIITAAEKFVGKLTGDIFQKLGDGYMKTFAPELVGDKALRADAYMAKYKTEKQAAENSYYRQSNAAKRAWDKIPSDERIKWLYDHETGRWNEEDDPQHARYAALYDAMFKEEKKAIGADSEKGYKENYLPHQWEKPDEVMRFFRSEPMVSKYGSDWFTKASTFKLVQEAHRAGFKLKTDNPESMLVARQLASHDMLATMDLLHNLENDGIAKPARAFSVDKRIAKTQNALTEAREKYKAASDKINDPKQLKWDFADPIVSKYMKMIQERVDRLQTRLDEAKAEKASNKLTPQQMAELKGNSFKVIGPDSKVWQIHQQAGSLWKNAMESKGLWENQGVVGDAYRFYNAGKAIWTQIKLGLSLFHPVHVAMINLASGTAAIAEHLIQGGKISDLALSDTGAGLGLSNTVRVQDHPAIRAWNAAPETRTPEQAQMVRTMVEGGFKPTISARDKVHFRENFDKAIAGIGTQNLRLLATAASLPGTLMKPFFEHWIPGLKSEMYFRRAELAMTRDPSLAADAGRRGEMLRQIAKDTDRTYGEMNQDVQFWNKTLKDSFNAGFISGGWKLAQIYNARGLLEPGKIAYNYLKTGEFSKDDITYNMLHAYAYTALTLATGAVVNKMLGNPIGTAKDTVWDIVKNLVAPMTGEKNPDGTPIRLNQPAFAKEAYNLAHEINTRGLIGGTGEFLYHQTLLPSIVDTLSNQDFTGRTLISDATDLHQWMNAGWDTISPISVEQYMKSESKHSEVGKIAGVLGFPTAGAYLNQTPFEQKVIHLYDEQNPPKGDVYSSKLKSDLRYEMAKGDAVAAEKTRKSMRDEGMTDSEISHAEKVYTKPFVEDAWKKLPVADQRRLIESASDEERARFKLKSH